MEANDFPKEEPPSRDLTPESLRGPCDTCGRTVLPSVLPATLLQAPGGFHRFEPVVWTGSLPPGAISYPTRNFATLGPFSAVTPHSRPSRKRVARSFPFPPGSPRRRGARTISSRTLARVRRMASEDSACKSTRPFLLIVRTARIVTAVGCATASTVGFSEFPAYSRIYLRNYKGVYSYGRRLPGLRFTASPPK